ncbi:hypothetical protein BO70DRAFT_359740 [Aspergillus heteromorphus CBS 117.55]|uniref:Uncharacterized protein n=1 Tax=Aspergillus heteromorphus CBS 117.55 TaxID=1448321 RepID=A0A317WPB6_9EURO|nr:uncharacterized protein BO70DRAFT_359740 [Aspergillus heteromorphus CBS 117.55]PWY88296.1 hypothetical protein BO70DRAFT_359740 [Aspergillus heteromorphus CBS 117.55]
MAADTVPFLAVYFLSLFLSYISNCARHAFSVNLGQNQSKLLQASFVTVFCTAIRIQPDTTENISRLCFGQELGGRAGWAETSESGRGGDGASPPCNRRYLQLEMRSELNPSIRSFAEWVVNQSRLQKTKTKKERTRTRHEIRKDSERGGKMDGNARQRNRRLPNPRIMVGKSGNAQ